MPKKKKNLIDNDGEPSPSGGMGNAPSSGGGGGGGGGGEYDENEVNQMLEKSRQTGAYINPSHFSSRRAWQEYYSRLDNSIKRGNKEGSARNRASDEAYARRGGNFNDLGIKNVKEEGQARYRRLGMHNLDRSYSYDPEKGVKYNIATSDDNLYMKPVPMTADDYAEFDAIKQYGNTPEGFFRRMQDSTRNQMNTWAAQNAVKGGSLRKDEHGLFMTGDQGERVDFDEFGNLIDANTGQRIGDHQYGFGTDLLGAAKSAGYRSPWASPGGAPKGPTTPSGQPLPPDSPSASSGVPSGPPGVAGPQPVAASGGFGTSAPSALSAPSAMTSMGNSWNRQAVTQQRPSTPPTPTSPMGSRPPQVASGGMGTKSPSMVGQTQRPAQPQGQQPRRITFAY